MSDGEDAYSKPTCVACMLGMCVFVSWRVWVLGIGCVCGYYM